MHGVPRAQRQQPQRRPGTRAHGREVHRYAVDRDLGAAEQAQRERDRGAAGTGDRSLGRHGGDPRRGDGARRGPGGPGVDHGGQVPQSQRPGPRDRGAEVHRRGGRPPSGPGSSRPGGPTGGGQARRPQGRYRGAQLREPVRGGPQRLGGTPAQPVDERHHRRAPRVARLDGRGGARGVQRQQRPPDPGQPRPAADLGVEHQRLEVRGRVVERPSRRAGPPPGRRRPRARRRRCRRPGGPPPRGAAPRPRPGRRRAAPRPRRPAVPRRRAGPTPPGRSVRGLRWVAARIVAAQVRATGSASGSHSAAVARLLQAAGRELAVLRGGVGEPERRHRLGQRTLRREPARPREQQPRVAGDQTVRQHALQWPQRTGDDLGAAPVQQLLDGRPVLGAHVRAERRRHLARVQQQLGGPAVPLAAGGRAEVLGQLQFEVVEQHLVVAELAAVVRRGREEPALFQLLQDGLAAGGRRAARRTGPRSAHPARWCGAGTRAARQAGRRAPPGRGRSAPAAIPGTGRPAPAAAARAGGPR